MLMAENQNQSEWKYNPVDGVADQQDPSTQPQQTELTWTASEFVANHKNARWHGLFLVATAIVAAITYLLTKDVISTISIVVVGILFMIISNKKPRQLSYAVSNDGISIGGKFYPFASFKSFAVVYEGAISSISLMPIHRLQPDLTIYYPPESERQIFDLILAHLPNDQAAADKIIDRFARKIRF